MDAYTIKKVLPRLVLAVIFIQLSFFIVSVLVDVFNVLGSGVLQLVEAPIKGFPTFELNLAGESGTLVQAGGGVLATGAVFLGGAALFFYLLTILPTVALIILATLVTFIVRQSIIVVLVVLAPVAFVAWTLPNTERIFKSWLEFLLKALAMFPLIMLLIGMGELMGAATAATNDNLFGSAVSIISVFAPYAMIPFTFKFAGSAVAAIGNTVNNLAQGRGLNGKGGGGGGGRGAPGSWRDRYKQRVGNLQTRVAAGQSRLNRIPFAGRAGEVMSRGGLKFRDRDKARAAGAYRGLTYQGISKLKEENLENDRDALKLIGLNSKDNIEAEIARLTAADDTRGAASLQSLYTERYGALSQHMNNRDMSMAATTLRGAQGMLDESDFYGSARLLSGNAAIATSHIKTLSEAAGRSGRHQMVTFGYDGNGGIDRDEAGMDGYIMHRSAESLVGSHYSAVPHVIASLDRNMTTSPDETVRQLGGILANPDTSGELRAEVEALVGRHGVGTAVRRVMEDIRGT